MRLKISSLLAISLLLVSLSVVLFPAAKPDPLGILGLLLFIALIATARGWLWRRPAWCFWPLFVVTLLVGPFVVIMQGFGTVDMIAFMFHAEFGVGGAGLLELRNEIFTAVLALLWVLFAAWALSSLYALRNKLYIGLMALLLVTHPLVIFAFHSLSAQVGSSDLASKLKLAPEWSGKAPEADVLLLYLEGLEEIFFDQELYGDTMDDVAAFRSAGLSFGAVRQIEATGWSMAGVVASQCGIPLVPNGFRTRNNFHGVDDYLGSHRCLGDVMRDAGFDLEFVVGGELRFAGLGTFLKQHGYNKIMGKKHFRDSYPRKLIKRASIDWIVDDQLVFEEALKRHKKLAKRDRPFGLVVETMTPHGDIAYASRECRADGRASLDRDTEKVLACFSEQTQRFVAELQAQQGTRPLRIVIMSDHLNHNPKFKKELDLASRANTLILMGPNQQPARNLKEGSMVDVYPTLLEWLGLVDVSEPVRAGLGVSLLSDAPTLVEEKGFRALNAELYVNPGLSNAVWVDDSWSTP
ncbi:sulfatase-like hydrolase/transferase [Lentibacter algarum]|uniref:sulfatase-like hydrolase/transferase n=1 Tax=Lentibacter algarum TaxID=576131 RepID=UPI001C0823AE|nr:sulfatase-like hydrolase/transferase [Lentibacter algarum]MBU2983377.1 sulfatase-like hydrolase/transferase [Lentibacter algarum]